ncbi:MAG: UDP-N-acetylmuramoyl-L-alanyl-D-glutamate--2,6-diaminopimelate ligase [Patescibacteria group bacterium]|nr:UDP-N-acetylmuramoyl-L-alanyl-D-glutamate--2,6-diaminopimelate ligase [Patescibacteria group bacterium]MDW8279696.1 UDP-N-acetylmuramoyl-L-alanyl-D-glutamate--2,6-diaminopimelate ligase [bacterium]
MNSFLDNFIEKLKKIKFLKKIAEIPFINTTYHFILAFLGSLIYNFPSKKLTVIGVAGTKGKSTTSYLIYRILNEAGFKTGLISTPLIGIGNQTWPNKSKQTMLGRFAIQQLIKKMVEQNCKFAVVETSSEGILQNRHRFIDYKIGIFTNLPPDHLERHGGFANYRRANVKLFKKISKRIDGIGIYNLDDENVEYFLEPNINFKYGYTLQKESNEKEHLVSKLIRISKYELYPNKTIFYIHNKKFETQFVGLFNLYNILAAIAAVLTCGVDSQTIQKVLPLIEPPIGRFEVIQAKSFKIVVDYAHEPKSLESIYEASKLLNPQNMICLLGSQGGGRDVWKRPKMGEIAAKYCDYIILTNEDPYDENPENILNDIENGILNIDSKNKKCKKYFKIIDRREAIKQAISLANKNDVVILTGKGGEIWMCIENNKKIPWNESEIVKEILKELKLTN